MIQRPERPSITEQPPPCLGLLLSPSVTFPRPGGGASLESFKRQVRGDLDPTGRLSKLPTRRRSGILGLAIGSDGTQSLTTPPLNMPHPLSLEQLLPLRATPHVVWTSIIGPPKFPLLTRLLVVSPALCSAGYRGLLPSSPLPPFLPLPSSCRPIPIKIRFVFSLGTFASSADGTP